MTYLRCGKAGSLLLPIPLEAGTWGVGGEGGQISAVAEFRWKVFGFETLSCGKWGTTKEF